MCKLKSQMAHKFSGHRSRVQASLYICISMKYDLNSSENLNAYISALPFHEYIQNLFMTCTGEVGDPVLSQNMEPPYVLPKSEQEKELFFEQRPRDILRTIELFYAG